MPRKSSKCIDRKKRVTKRPRNGRRLPSSAAEKEKLWARVRKRIQSGESVAHVAREEGVAAYSIYYRVRKYGWVQPQQLEPPKDAPLVDSPDIIEAAVEDSIDAAKRILEAHQREIGAARAAVGELWAELQRLIVLQQQRQQGQKKALAALHAASTIAQRLASAMDRLVPLERQAYGLGDETPSGEDVVDAFEARIRRIIELEQQQAQTPPPIDVVPDVVQ